MFDYTYYCIIILLYYINILCKKFILLFNLINLKMQQTINECADKFVKKLISLSESKESIAVGG